MSSTLTSGAVIQSLDAVSLSKHAVIVDDHRDNTSTAKDGQDASHSPGDGPATEDHPDDTSTAKERQDASHSPGDRPLTEDHPNDISTTSDGRDTDHSLRDPSKDGSAPGYRSPLTQEDTDFCAAVLFCKQFLEMGRTQGSRSQESNPLLGRISGFWKTNAPQADLDHNPQITAVDDISIARSNNQSALTTANSSASAKEGLPRSPQSSDIIEEYSKHTQHGGDRYKPRREKAPKRVLSEVRRTTVVILDSDGEEEMEITTTDDSLSDRLIKRPRLAKEDKAIPVTARPRFPEGSVKASSDDEAKGRRKSRTRTRVTAREFTGHLNTEATWLNTASTRCNTLRKLFAKQRQHLAALDTLDTEHCQILAEMSADRLPRSTRLQLGKELRDLEKRRSEVTAELRQAMNSGSSEGAAMKQDLEQWDIKEKKVTERIERSR